MRVCYGPMIPQIKAQFKGYSLETRTVSLATPVSPPVSPAQPLRVRQFATPPFAVL